MSDYLVPDKDRHIRLSQDQEGRSIDQSLLHTVSPKPRTRDRYMALVVVMVIDHLHRYRLTVEKEPLQTGIQE